MKKALLIACLVLAAHSVFATRYSQKTHTYSQRSYSYSGTQRDTHGRIRRSEAAKEDFMRQTGYPHGRPCTV